MISIPTTLVLGAGASMPYGFPSGAALRRTLCSPSNLRRLIDHIDCSAREIEIFCETFLRSGMASIDAFLAHRGEHQIIGGGQTFSEIGKAAIAFVLIDCEQRNKLFNLDVEDDWYQYLWQFVGGDSFDAIAENQLQIVTFNYDRSLEAYFLSAIRNAYGVSEERAAEQFAKIPITHVYGKLGGISCLSKGAHACRSFPSEIDRRNIEIAAAGIKVIGEHREDGPEFLQARKAIGSAERICFLGFGFDQTNIRRLGVEEVLQDRFRNEGFARPMTYATTLGMQPAERDRVVRILSPQKAKAPTFLPAEINNLERLSKAIRDGIVGPSGLQNNNFLRHRGVFHEY